MIKFYFHTTPNPMKIALYLEETGLPYELIPIDTYKGEQHSAAFKKINPNEKLPAIIDSEGKRVFDSTAILLYLSEKTGKLAGNPEDRSELLSWMMFLATGLGPFSGQSVHFRLAAPEKIPYAINRYLREAQRHYQVLDEHLAQREYMVGDTYTIADISAWGWIDKAKFVLGEHELEAYPHLKTWFEKINHRTAVAKVRKMSQAQTFKKEMDEETARALFPSNFADKK